MVASWIPVLTAAFLAPSLRTEAGYSGARWPVSSRPALPAVHLRRAPYHPRLMTETATAAGDDPLETVLVDAATECPTEDVTSMELLKFILPTLAGWLSSEMMSVVDTAVVGSCSAAELAALGPATMLTDSAAYLFFWLNVATTSLFATALASGDSNEAYDTLSDALYCALACSTVMTLALFSFGPAALAAICASAPQVAAAATTYLNIRLLGLPAFMAGMVLQAACLGAKDSISPLVVLVTCGLLNLGLDLYLVNVVGMGIGGAAIATLASQVVQALMLAFVVQRKRRAAGAGTSWLLLRGGPSWRRISKFLSFAGPIFLVLCGKISCYNAMTLAATAGGIAALAGHQAMISIFFVGCKFGDAVSQTSQAFLPACYDYDESTGARPAPPPRAQRLSGRLLRLSALLGGIVSVLAYAFATRAPTVFTRDPAVLGAMSSVAPLLFVALLVHAVTMTSEGLLLGARQLSFLAKAYAGNVLVFLSGLFLIARRGMGLGAVWRALAAFQLVRAATFALRLRSVGLSFRRRAADDGDEQEDAALSPSTQRR